MRVVRRLLRVIALIVVLPGSVWAQHRSEPHPPSGEPATPVEDVLVQGRLVDQEAQRFVEAAQGAVPGRGLARWRGPVCIGVMNLRREVGLQIADGLAHAGGALGVPIADGECEPNILLIGAVDAREVAAGWVGRAPREFRPNIAHSVLSRERLTEFTASEAPVRWWAISRPSYFNILSGRAAPTNGPWSAPIVVHSYSLKERHIRDDLQRLVVILDVDRVQTVSFENLLAYLTMVSFTQIDMRADMRGLDTVLNLFGEDWSGAGLTGWDRAYIKSLYEVPRDLRIDVQDQPGRLASRFRLEAPVPGNEVTDAP